MNINKKLTDKFFRSVDNCVWDLMTGRIGFSTTDGIVTIDLNELDDLKTEAPDAQVSVNLFDEFGIAIPAFAQSVPVDSITLGDMIYSSSSNKVLGWVVKKNAKSFKLMKQDGTKTDWVPPKVNMLGFDSGVMVLRSLMNMLPGGSSGLTSMQSMLMPMMALGMMGEGANNNNMKNMLPVMLMSQMGGMASADTTNPNPMTNMMPMIMMMQMMKSPSSNNSFTNFFDSK